MKYSKTRKIYIALSAVILLAVLTIIFVLSAQNGQDSSSTSGWVVEFLTTVFGTMPKENTIRMLAHFCEFAGLGFLFSNFIFSLKDKPKPILSFSLSSAYALTDEIHQYFVPGRACQFTDWFVDSCGVVLGVVMFCILIKIITEMRHKKTH